MKRCTAVNREKPHETGIHATMQNATKPNPTVNKGKQLYLNFFDYNDHIRIEKLIDKVVNCDWIITYDDEPEVEKIYEKYCKEKIELNYSVATKRKSMELIIFKNNKVIQSLLDLESKGIKIKLKETCND